MENHNANQWHSTSTDDVVKSQSVFNSHENAVTQKPAEEEELSEKSKELPYRMPTRASKRPFGY